MWYVYRRNRSDGQHRAQELVVEVPDSVVGIHIHLTPGIYFLATEHGHSEDAQVVQDTTAFIEQPHDPMPFQFVR